jgi:hypothetical protein
MGMYFLDLSLLIRKAVSIFLIYAIFLGKLFYSLEI